MDWPGYFARNRERRLEIPWEKGIEVKPHLRRPLIRSRQRFHVGEQGEGKFLSSYAAATGDPAYAASVRMFVREEQEHVRLLAGMIQTMGGELLQAHWSESAFRRLRRSCGLEMELVVLLTAELVGEYYYRALHEAIDDPVLSTACKQIWLDEVGHVAFQCDTLRRTLLLRPLLVRLAVRAGWRLLYRVACLVLVIDHHAALSAISLAPRVFWQECGVLFDRAVAQVFASARAVEESGPALTPGA